jgi:hypothetical protein
MYWPKPFQPIRCARSASSRERIPETGYHRGVDVPTEQLAFWHADDLYANLDLRDPSIDMATVYNLGLDYGTYKALFANPRQNAYDSSVQWNEFARWIGRIAVQNAAYSILYWFMYYTVQIPGEDLPTESCTEPNKLRTVKSKIMDTWRLTLADTTQLLCANEQKFRDKIAQFRADHAAEIAAVAANEGVTQGWAGVFLLERKYQEWMRQR